MRRERESFPLKDTGKGCRGKDYPEIKRKREKREKERELPQGCQKSQHADLDEISQKEKGPR